MLESCQWPGYVSAGEACAHTSHFIHIEGASWQWEHEACDASHIAVSSLQNLPKRGRGCRP